MNNSSLSGAMHKALEAQYEVYTGTVVAKPKATKEGEEWEEF